MGYQSFNHHYYHQGMVVRIDQPVQGKHQWFIHKGTQYGDDINTTITDASYMNKDFDYIDVDDYPRKK